MQEKILENKKRVRIQKNPYSLFSYNIFLYTFFAKLPFPTLKKGVQRFSSGRSFGKERSTRQIARLAAICRFIEKNGFSLLVSTNQLYNER